MITVGRKWDRDARYIGRGSALGNPFVMHNESMRNLVCDQYQAWFEAKVEAKDPDVMRELSTLLMIARANGRVTLGCFCAPKRCHGDTIKNYLEKQ